MRTVILLAFLAFNGTVLAQGICDNARQDNCGPDQGEARSEAPAEAAAASGDNFAKPMPDEGDNSLAAVDPETGGPAGPSPDDGGRPGN